MGASHGDVCGCLAKVNRPCERKEISPAVALELSSIRRPDRSWRRSGAGATLISLNPMRETREDLYEAARRWQGRRARAVDDIEP